MINNFDFIANLPGLLVVKDLDSNFINMNDRFAKALGWQSGSDCRGKTDFDLPCPASEFAEGFRRLDKQVLSSGKTMLALEIQEYASGYKLILSEKNPIKDNTGNIIVTYHSCTDVTEVDIFKSYAHLHQHDCHFNDNKFKPASYILTEAHSPISLTDKQHDVLFFLIRGKSIKEIAKILLVSPRTVESHIDLIKNKLHCQYKSEVIEKAIDCGYLYYIPKRFQKL